MFGDAVRGRTIAVAAVLLFVAACSDSPGPDTTPPSAVTDLALVGTTDSTLTVTWTAPGDDGERGQATAYDLRYTLAPLPAGWDSATAVPGLLLPRQAGQAETVAVGGLEPHLLYQVGLKTDDDAGNVSGLSNIVEGETGDLAPPAQVTDLQADDVAPHAVTLTFTAPGDDGWFGKATAYILRRAPYAVTEETWVDADSVRVAIPTVTGGQRVTYRLQGLTPGTSTYYAVRARDDAAKVGPVSNPVLVDLPLDTVPPSRITDLAAASPGPFQATLTWTAPGDDGNHGRAARYEAGFASSAITSDSWSEARTVTLPITPKEAGETEEVGLGGFPGETTLWFAIRAVDAAGNQGAVSNSPSAYVRPEARTWEVRVDGTGDAPTIQAGIDSASDGELVLVHPGTYYEHIDFHGKNVHVKSAEGAETTVIDGSSGPGPVITFQSRETNEATLEGLTITGGSGVIRGDGALVVGGGIYSMDASPTITHNVIVENTVGYPDRGWGGGLSLNSTYSLHTLPHPVVTDNVLARNHANTNGGALYVGDVNVTLQRNSFRENEATYDGGAIYIFTSQAGTVQLLDNEFWQNVAGDHGGAVEAGQQGYHASPLLVHGNLFVRNEAHGEDLPTDSGTGGGISMRGWSGTISNNTFVGNIGTGGAPCTGGALLLASGTLPVYVERNIFAGSQGCAVACRGAASGTQLTGNIFWGNDPGDVGNATGCFPYSASEHFFNDPLFCDPAHDDYHVRSDSPALSDTLVMGAFAEPGCSP